MTRLSHRPRPLAMDLYQYDLVEATPFIVRVVDHLLNCQEDNLRLPESFKKELKAWKASESGVQLGKCVTCDNVKVISFSMIKRIHEHLKRNPIGNYHYMCIINTLQMVKRHFFMNCFKIVK